MCQMNMIFSFFNKFNHVTGTNMIYVDTVRLWQWSRSPSPILLFCCGSEPGCQNPSTIRVLSFYALALKESESSSVIEYDFETIHNTAPYETEIAITFRETFRSWNMCVQWWLVTYIYKKLPGTPFIRYVNSRC